MEERAFAYILYLTPNWKKEYGGCLRLYQSDSTGINISALAKSIVPIENEFVFFQVQHNSWHSVEEVFVDGLERVSINGWFYSSKVIKWDSVYNSIDISRCITYSDFKVSILFKLNNIFMKSLN